MADVKSKFTLHRQYKEFISQQTEIAFSTLSPNIHSLSPQKLGDLLVGTGVL
jgi:hypothetical protein